MIQADLFNPKETDMTDIVIVAAQRTAVGKFGGTLAKTTAPDLGAHVVKGLLEKAGLVTRAPSPDDERARARTRRARPSSSPACRLRCRH